MIIGVDTGISGGMALLQDAVLVECIETPYYWHTLKTKSKKTGKFKRRRKLSYYVLAETMQAWVDKGATQVIIEQVHPMQGNGVISAFSQGEAFGAFTSVSAALGLPITLVTPSQWKKVHKLLHTDKKESLERARCLFGTKWFPLMKDHNKAEAALIASCGLELIASNKLQGYAF